MQNAIRLAALSALLGVAGAISAIPIVRRHTSEPLSRTPQIPPPEKKLPYSGAKEIARRKRQMERAK